MRLSGIVGIRRESNHVEKICSACLRGSAPSGACAGTQLITRAADPRELQGKYTLYLYGCHYPDDVENAAFLVARDTKYPFELYTLESSYKVWDGLPAREALWEAEAFVRCGMHTVWYTRLRTIPDGQGGILGYEMVPVYMPYDMGTEDVLMITYALRDGKVRTVIQPNPRRERDSWRSESWIEKRVLREEGRRAVLEFWRCPEGGWVKTRADRRCSVWTCPLRTSATRAGNVRFSPAVPPPGG